MPVVVLQSAKDDLLNGYLFYERQGGSYLGNYFLTILQADLASLSDYAGIHNKRFGFHRALSRRFPYSIYYDIEDGEARIYAVLDNRRSPNWTCSHLRTARRFQSHDAPSLQ